MKNLVLIGAPGSGKGTASQILINDLDWKQLSTGDLLREEIKNKTDFGKEVSIFVNKGMLVPDELIINIVKNKIKDIDKNIIWDGFPRTTNQAKALDIMLKEFDRKINTIIYLQIDKEELISRITNRLVCPDCKNTFNILFCPPKIKNICDNCSAELIQRPDDNLEKFELRYKSFIEETMPLLAYYEENHKIHTFNSTLKKEDFTKELINIVESSNNDHNQK